MIRVYYNSSDKAERPWSVDLGDESTEITCDYVCLNGSWTSQAGNASQPKAWLESRSVAILDDHILSTGKRLVVIG